MDKAIALAALVLVAAADAPVRAQSSVQERPLTWHVDAGYSETTGRTQDYLDGGWIVSGGMTWRPRPDTPFSLKLDAHYSEYDATDRLINIGSAATQTRIDDGTGSTLGLDLNGVFDFPLGSRMRGYLTAGVGADRRRIELTQTALFNGVVCDPWWGLCGIGAVPGDVLVARDTTTRFAWNGGLGVEFPLSRGALFLDATYHRIETRRPTEYVPIVVGIRF
jgi:opacity protein-like surface antigen